MYCLEKKTVLFCRDSPGCPVPVRITFRQAPLRNQVTPLADALKPRLLTPHRESTTLAPIGKSNIRNCLFSQSFTSKVRDSYPIPPFNDAVIARLVFGLIIARYNIIIRLRSGREKADLRSDHHADGNLVNGPSARRRYLTQTNRVPVEKSSTISLRGGMRLMMRRILPFADFDEPEVSMQKRSSRS